MLLGAIRIGAEAITEPKRIRAVLIAAGDRTVGWLTRSDIYVRLTETSGA
jgi:hypothetical protein